MPVPCSAPQPLPGLPPPPPLVSHAFCMPLPIPTYYPLPHVPLPPCLPPPVPMVPLPPTHLCMPICLSLPCAQPPCTLCLVVVCCSACPSPSPSAAAHLKLPTHWFIPGTVLVWWRKDPGDGGTWTHTLDSRWNLFSSMAATRVIFDTFDIVTVTFGKNLTLFDSSHLHSPFSHSFSWLILTISSWFSDPLIHPPSSF